MEFATKERVEVRAANIVLATHRCPCLPDIFLASSYISLGRGSYQREQKGVDERTC